MLLASSALAFGFLHGLWADHLMTVAALSVGGGTNPVRGRAFGVAVRFACGHAALLAAGAVVLAGWQISAMNAAPCSWCVRMKRTDADCSNEIMKSPFSSPGPPKTYRSPSSRGSGRRDLKLSFRRFLLRDGRPSSLIAP